MALKKKKTTKDHDIKYISIKASKSGNVTCLDTGLTRRNKLSLSPARIIFVFFKDNLELSTQFSLE